MEDKIVKIKVNDNATLRIRSSKINAIVSSKGNDHIDIYVEGVATPFHADYSIKNDLIDQAWGDLNT